MASTPATDEQIAEYEAAHVRLENPNRTEAEFQADWFIVEKLEVDALIARIKAEAAKVAELEAENLKLRYIIVGHFGPDDLDVYASLDELEAVCKSEMDRFYAAGIEVISMKGGEEWPSYAELEAENEKLKASQPQAPVASEPLAQVNIVHATDASGNLRLINVPSDLFTGTAIRCFAAAGLVWAIRPRGKCFGRSDKSIFETDRSVSTMTHDSIPELTPQAAHDSLSDWPEAQAELRRLCAECRKAEEQIGK